MFLVFSNSLIYNLFLFFFLLSKEYLSSILRISIQPSSDYSCLHKLRILCNKGSERPQCSRATFIMSYQGYILSACLITHITVHGDLESLAELLFIKVVHLKLHFLTHFLYWALGKEVTLCSTHLGH